MLNYLNQVKRYCNLFFLLFSFFLYSGIANCRGVNTPVNGCTLSISPDLCHTCPMTNMHEKMPHNGYTVLLFRAGLEGKTFLVSFIAANQFLYVGNRFTDIALINLIRIKHILSHSDLLASPPEFLSAFTSHAPPVLY